MIDRPNRLVKAVMLGMTDRKGDQLGGGLTRLTTSAIGAAPKFMFYQQICLIQTMEAKIVIVNN